MAHLNRLSHVKSEIKYMNTLTIESVARHSIINLECKFPTLQLSV